LMQLTTFFLNILHSTKQSLNNKKVFGGLINHYNLEILKQDKPKPQPNFAGKPINPIQRQVSVWFN